MPNQKIQITFLKQDLADFKFNASEKSGAVEKLEKEIDQLWSKHL